MRDLANDEYPVPSVEMIKPKIVSPIVPLEAIKSAPKTMTINEKRAKNKSLLLEEKPRRFMRRFERRGIIATRSIRLMKAWSERRNETSRSFQWKTLEM